MSQNLDPVDKMIMDSNIDYQGASSYNDSLLRKLKSERLNKESSLIAGLSFIMAGILAIFLYNSDIQYELLNIQAKARSEIISLHHYYSNKEIIKLLIGE